MHGPIQEGFVSALMVGEYENDRILVHDVFRRLGWRLFETRGRRQSIDLLGRHPVQVVLAESPNRRWDWKRVLSDLRQLPHPPQLIVTSRSADDALWAEVLNMGGYDVLVRPFRADEVERVVAAARRHFNRPEPARPLAASGAA